MATKDKLEKSLEECNDVFADIVNVLLFEGKDIIKDMDLKESSPYSNYTANGKVRDQERDVVKFWNNSKIRIAKIGFENQTDEDPDMPLRVLSYDGAGYRAQFSPANNNSRYPVVSMVLYYGYEHKWREPKSLKKCLVIPPELNKYVSDYKINVFDIAFLSDNIVNQFKSDFKLVADYFVQMRKTGKYIPPTEDIVHVQELLSLMTALTDDSRFIETYEAVKGRKRVNMCKVLDEIEGKGIKKGIEKGIKKGIKKGLETGRDNTLYSLVHDGLLNVNEAAKRAEKSVKEFKKGLQEYVDNSSED